MLSGARGEAGDPNALPLPRLPRFSGIREVTKSTSGREETTLQRGPRLNKRPSEQEGGERAISPLNVQMEPQPGGISRPAIFRLSPGQTNGVF